MQQLEQEIPGSLIVIDATGVHWLPRDAIGGCARGLAGSLDSGEGIRSLDSIELPEPDEGSGPTRPVRTQIPLVLEADGRGSFWICGRDGDGELVPAGTAAVLAACRRPRDEGWIARLLTGAGGPELEHLREAGVLAVGAEGVGPLQRRARRRERAYSRLHRSLTSVEVDARDDRIQVAAVWARTGTDELVPLGLGYLLALIRARPDFDRRFQGSLLTPGSPEELARVAAALPPSVFLFSDYVWNVTSNLAYSEAVKAASPAHLVVHGGPSVPAYEAERIDFMASNPVVDILVHGEGEATFAELLDRVGRSGLESSTVVLDLAGTPGTTVRGQGGLVVGPPRSRIEQLGDIPSPFLTGVFDELVAAGLRRFILETNRGCPFGCTFCDWGSATNTRIRTFPLLRVEAELDWLAAREVELVILADANFGMLPRDAAIADRIASSKERTGHPERLALSMGKNPNARFHEIMRRLTGAELLSFGGLSLQTYDSETLANIDRRNIPANRYDEIWRQLREDGTSMTAEFMVGLPGATRETFRKDLQFGIEREVPVIMHRTILLPNNPMNAPEYRSRFAIEADDDGAVCSTYSFDASDLIAMLSDYQATFAADHLGALRVFLRFARQRSGRTEVDLATALAAEARARPTTMPCVRWFLTASTRWGCAPAGWDRFLEEVRHWWVVVQAMADDTALAAVLHAQRAIIPHPTRRYPMQIVVGHDVVAWYEQVRQAALAGEHWPEVVPDLGTFPPGELSVGDPWQVAQDLAVLAQPTGVAGWDIDSPFRRPGPRGALLTL